MALNVGKISVMAQQVAQIVRGECNHIMTVNVEVVRKLLLMTWGPKRQRGEGRARGKLT